MDTASGEYFDVDPIAWLEGAARLGSSWCEALDWIATRADLGAPSAEKDE